MGGGETPSLSKRRGTGRPLHALALTPQAVWTQRLLQRLQPAHPSQRDGDEGPGKRLPPEGVCVCLVGGWVRLQTGERPFSCSSSQCFSCATCRIRLVPGDRFHYVNGTIFCEQDRPGSVLLGSNLPPLQDGSMSDQKVRVCPPPLDVVVPLAPQCDYTSVITHPSAPGGSSTVNIYSHLCVCVCDLQVC